MAINNYKVSIEPRNGFVLPNYIPPVFLCSVSTPSAFGASPRGLAFSDMEMRLLNSDLFINLHTFHKTLPGNPPILTEIEHLIVDKLNSIGITPTHVNVRVTYWDPANK